ncbi:unnamed protein product [Phaeothamnion confervicola]
MVRFTAALLAAAGLVNAASAFAIVPAPSSAYAVAPRAAIARAAPGGAPRHSLGKRSLAPRTSATDAPVTQKGRVTVYHKTTCPYCKEVLQLLEGDYGLEVTCVDVLEGEDSDQKIKQMRTFSGGRNTVPQVFFNSEHLGGNDDVQALHRAGKLEGLVAKVREEASAVMKDGWYHPWY